MANAATTPTSRVRLDALANTPAETAKRRDVYDQAPEKEPRLRSPQEFYAEFTKRADVREILKQLAES